MLRIFCFVAVFVISIQCKTTSSFGYQGNPLLGWIETSSPEIVYDPYPLFKRYPTFIADQFEFPVGGKFGEGYYLSQRFGVENPRFGNRFHLGEDWSHIAGGDSDFGAPVYAIASGIVSSVGDFGGGWGKVIRVIHRIPDLGGELFYEALYAHLYSIEVEPGAMVQKGEWIATIGNADGTYVSHLHLELRTKPHLPRGGGYDFNKENYLSMTRFLASRLAKEKSISEDQYLLNGIN